MEPPVESEQPILDFFLIEAAINSRGLYKNITIAVRPLVGSTVNIRKLINRDRNAHRRSYFEESGTRSSDILTGDENVGG